MTKNNLAEELLRELLVVNKNGVWFIRIPYRDAYYPVPKWMVNQCKQALKNPEKI